MIQGSAHDVEGEVTCIALSTLEHETVLLAGIWEAGRPILMIYPQQALDSQRRAPIRLDVASCKSPSAGKSSFPI